MSLRDRIPVEPLEDDRLVRIERAVIAGLPARRPRRSPWRLAAPMAIAAVVAAAVLVVWRAGERPDPTPAEPAPVAVTAAPDGARVDLGDAVITTGAGATFTVTRPGGGVAVHLARGRIELEVAPRGERPPLIVHADDVDVVVVGTRFSVEWDDQVTVAVTEGLVRVERGGDVTMLAAGQEWSAPAHVAVASLEPAVAPAGRTGRTPEVELEPEPAAPAPAAEIDEPRPVRKPRGKDRPAAAPPADPFAELRTEIKGVAVAPAVDVGERGEVALAVYRKRAGKTGPEAAQALYGLARVQMSLGHDSESLRNLDRYVERFPSGAELEDVLWLRLRIQCLRTIDAKCRRAAHTFLAKFGGDSARARIAERVTHTE